MGKRIKYLILYLLIYSSSQLIAGDYLTNTNQSVNFLRNPARYARISVDGIYYNCRCCIFGKRLVSAI